VYGIGGSRLSCEQYCASAAPAVNVQVIAVPSNVIRCRFCQTL
jgi:hypothetical protein